MARPAPKEPNALPPVVVFDVGGTWLRSGVWTPQGLVDVTRTPTPSFHREPGKSVRRLQDELVQQIVGDSARLVARHAGVARAAVSMGAALDARTGRVIGSGPLWGPRSEPLELAAELRRHAPQLEWHVVNDVTASLYRHVAAHRDRTDGRMAVVTISSGIAARVWDFARRTVPVEPTHGLQGEIGHLEVSCTFRGQRVHRRCDCGGDDHLGAFASGRGIVGLANDLAGDPIEPATFFAAVEAGDPWSRDVLAAGLDPLAATLCAMFTHDPELDPIALVGGVTTSLRGTLLATLLGHLERRGLYGITTNDPTWFRRRVTLGELDDDSGLIGCAFHANGIVGRARTP